MNSITTALKSAGVPLPTTTQRAWQWVHDHPGATAAQVNTAIKTAHSATLLNDLRLRGMVTSRKSEARSVGKRHVLCWTAVGDRYEILPRVKSEDAKWTPATTAPRTVREAGASAKPKATPALVEDAVATPAPHNAAVDIEGMTLHDLRALYAQLKELFK